MKFSLSQIRFDKVQNSYRGRLMIDGKRKSFYGKNKKVVREKFKSFLETYSGSIYIQEKVLFSQYVEYWFKKYKLNKIEPSSYSRLLGLYESRIKNTLGSMYIQDIKTADIQSLIDEFANPSNPSIRPLARSGLKKIKNLLNPCFNLAVKEGIINYNPCKDLIIPVESCVLVDTREQFSLSEEELLSFKKACLKKLAYKNEYVSRNNIILLLLVNLGLRIGEMLALRWSDIDFKDNVIRINKILQINIRSETGLNLDRSMRVKNSSKTKNGVRVLPLSDSVREYFDILKAYDERNSIKSDYVACTLGGDISRPQNFTRSLASIKKCAGLNHDVTLHTLRHTFGTCLLKKGVSVEIVSKLLGHSSITITYNTYIHVLQEEAAKSMKRLTIC